jgi:hypothetical protein
MIFQKPIPLTKKNISGILNGKTKYAVSTKCDGELVFVTCSEGNFVVKDINGVVIEKHFSDCDFRYVIHGERVQCPDYSEENKIYIFDFFCPRLSYRQRVDILKSLQLPTCCVINTIQFPEIKDTFKILELMTAKASTDGFVFTPCNVLVEKKDFSKYPIYKWKSKSQLTADLLIRRRHVYCGISKDQFNIMGEYNDCFNPSKYDYFGIIFGAGNERKLVCTGDVKHAGIICTDDHPCDYCSLYEEKVVECLYTKDGWKPVKVRADKTLQYNKSEIFSGPNNWKTVEDIVDETQNPIPFEELVKL